MTHICENYYLIKDGMGGFLNPPGDPEHEYSIREGVSRTNPQSLMSLTGAIDSNWVPDKVKQVAQDKLDNATREMSDAWVHSVYNYFRNCYSPDGIDRNVSNCLVSPPDANPEYHLAYLHIKQYFPEQEPRLDLIANDGPLGSWSKG